MTSRVLCVVCLLASVASADPITSRDYAIDVYDGVALGDAAQVGTGGASAARVVGSAGSLVNPSASAVRETTDMTDWFSFDFHLDYLTAKYSSDYDNNGSPAEGGNLLTLGLDIMLGRFAMQLAVTQQSIPVPSYTLEYLTATTGHTRFSIAYVIDPIDLALGAGLQSSSFQASSYNSETSLTESLFDFSGVGFLLGATWLPADQRFRLGAALETRVSGSDISTTCDPNDCEGYILPDHIESPAKYVLGGAYRFGPTPWNQPVKAFYRDERAITVAADVVVTGRSPEGHGLEAFVMHELQPSGRSVSVSLRAGADAEVIPGWLRLRGGTYWEPARFEDRGGRIHGTAGLDARLFQFKLGRPRRVRFGATADLAREFRNVTFSIGFWH